MKHNYKYWISFIKAIAIVGIVIQHTYGYAYTNVKIYYSTLFAVALFVLIGGYNSMLSYEKQGSFLVVPKIKKIFFPYLLASVVYLIYANHFLDMTILLKCLIHFNASLPLYYVAVYLQLVILTPVLIKLVIWGSEGRVYIKVPVLVFFTIVLTYVCFEYTNIFDIVLGGGKLFASPWLFFWVMGLLIRRFDNGFFEYTLQKGLCSVFFHTICVAVWHYVFIYKEINLCLDRIVFEMTYANIIEVFLLFFWIKGIFTLLEGLLLDVGEKKGSRLWIYIGDHSLFIFLYHMLFLDIYKRNVHLVGRINGVLCWVFVIICPLLAEIVIEKMKKIINVEKKEEKI